MKNVLNKSLYIVTIAMLFSLFVIIGVHFFLIGEVDDFYSPEFQDEMTAEIIELDSYPQRDFAQICLKTEGPNSGICRIFFIEFSNYEDLLSSNAFDSISEGDTASIKFLQGTELYSSHIYELNVNGVEYLSSNDGLNNLSEEAIGTTQESIRNIIIISIVTLSLGVLSALTYMKTNKIKLIWDYFNRSNWKPLATIYALSFIILISPFVLLIFLGEFHLFLDEKFFLTYSITLKVCLIWIIFINVLYLIKNIGRNIVTVIYAFSILLWGLVLL